MLFVTTAAVLETWNTMPGINRRHIRITRAPIAGLFASVRFPSTKHGHQLGLRPSRLPPDRRRINRLRGRSWRIRRFVETHRDFSPSTCADDSPSHFFLLTSVMRVAPKKPGSMRYFRNFCQPYLPIEPQSQARPDTTPRSSAA